MKKWNVYQKNGEEIEAVKNGFNWWAFFFVGIWALSKNLVWAGVIGLSLTIAANRMPDSANIIALPIISILMLVYGFMGNGWRAAQLEKRGYSHVGNVEAASAEGAKAKYHEARAISKTSSI
jgi:hypothetical protein